MRRTHAEQQEKLARVISALDELRKLQPEFISFLRTIESDSQEMQKIASQMETAVAGSAEAHTAAIEKLRDHLELQEERLGTFLESISEGIRALRQRRESSAPQRGFDLARLRRDMLRQNPALRFSVLKDWTSINSLAILQRAARGWKAPNDLIAHVPGYLEAEAEILNDRVLLIGTREHAERLAIALRELDSSSAFQHWFEVAPEGRPPQHIPAVLTGAGGSFELVSKGTGLATLTN
jgi:hypothetical protein